MISCRTLHAITGVLSNSFIINSAGELILCDAHSEVMGKIDCKTPGVIVYQGYTHSDKMIKRLKKSGIPFDLKEADMEDAMKILYDD